MPGKLSKLFKELKRRKVYRVATVYAITGWLIVQVAGLTFPYLNIPDSIVTIVIVLVLLGFPVAVILAWSYELSPEGIIKTTSEEAETNPLPASKKKPFTGTLTIIILSALVVAQFAYFVFIRNPGKEFLEEEIREEKVAVAVFNNFTDDTSLDAFGYMASDLITSGLRQLEVKTSSPEMMRKCIENVGILPGNLNNEVSLFEVTGAKFVVTGSYYLRGDELQISSQLESTETGEIIFDFPVVRGDKNDPERLIQEIREKLKGYWTVRKKQQLSKLTPAKYEAYQIFQSCRHTDYRCHVKSLEIDSSFMMARVFLNYSSYLHEMDSVYRANRKYILNHWDECTEFEKNYFNFGTRVKNMDYAGALEALNQNYMLDPLDPYMIHESAFFYLSLNQPDKAAERYETIINKHEVYRDKIAVPTLWHYTESLIFSGQSHRVLEFAEYLKEKFPEDLSSIKEEIILALFFSKDFKKLEEWIHYFEEKNIHPDYQLTAYYFNVLFPDAQKNYFEERLQNDLSEFSEFTENWGNYIMWTVISQNNYHSKAFITYILKDFVEAEKQAIELVNYNWEGAYISERGKKYWSRMDIWANGLLGSIYARQNKREKALEQIEILESKRAIFPDFVSHKSRGQIPYYQARIYAILGEKDMAVAYLKKSKAEGNIPEELKFVFDWDLTNLEGYPAYEDLLISFKSDH